MKPTVTLLLIICLMLSCAACVPESTGTCTFYYLRTAETIQYGKPDALVAPVTREIANEELGHLLQLYLDGPQVENYVSPIPPGTTLLHYHWEEGILVLTLSEAFSSLSGIQLTLAGACLTATCHALANAQAIQVVSGVQIYDFDLLDFTFLDDSVGE